MDLDLDLIVKLIGSLAVVIALLLATLYVMKRQGFAVNDSVHIETSVSVGPKERIMLVKCGQKQILVGVTASNISTLHVLDPDGYKEPEKEPEKESQPAQAEVSLIEQNLRMES